MVTGWLQTELRGLRAAEEREEVEEEEGEEERAVVDGA